MNSPIVPGSNNAAISAMAAATTQLKHDGIYYYSADLNKATDQSNVAPDSLKSTKDEDTYYYGGLQGAPPPSNAEKNPPKTSENDTYYDDGEVGAAVTIDAARSDIRPSPSKTGAYQNVSSLAAKSTFNTPAPKTSHPPLPVPPVPPVPMPPRAVLPKATPVQNIPKSTAKGQRKDEAETSFGSMPTYGNTGRHLPSQNPDTNYESLDNDTRDTSGVYAELT
ncbi:protein piccolo-like [Mizuhopecten yessoensis]|uniref:protein piccolo-like n=1 Tax=Mizuhopecten yessoensis TaxID=6573 RepID=UPI000B45D2B4|nr:protein piccolo-like [Mizuhopecten yessoensis]